MAEEQIPLASETNNYNYDSIDKKQIPQFQRKKGTQLLKINQYLNASKSFSKAIMAFQYLIKDNVITPQQIQKMLGDTVIPCYSNLTLCYLKLQHYESVIEFGNRIIQMNPKNVKAYYRRGLAYKKLKKYQESKEDFTRVKILDETMAVEIDKLLHQILLLEKKIKQKQKKIAEAFIKDYAIDKKMPEAEPLVQSSKEGIFRKSLNKIKRICQKLADMFKGKSKIQKTS